MTTSTIKTLIQSDLHSVWEMVLAVEHYGAWRSDLSRAEVTGENQFIEYTKQGYPTTFTVTATEPYRRWEFDLENSNMRGHWTGVFTPRGQATELAFTEQVTAKKLLMRPFVKTYLKKQQAQFVTDLKAALDGHASLEGPSHGEGEGGTEPF